jgi:hypothetical protein
MPLQFRLDEQGTRSTPWASSPRAATSPTSTRRTTATRNTGLPPSPINNPGEEALEAALNPADTDFLYFVTVNLKTGETKFAETFEEHEQNVAGVPNLLRNLRCLLTSAPPSRASHPVVGRCAGAREPIAHSLSPVLIAPPTRRWISDWDYTAREVTEHELAGFMAGLGRELAWPVADHAAEACGDRHVRPSRVARSASEFDQHGP